MFLAFGRRAHFAGQFLNSFQFAKMRRKLGMRIRHSSTPSSFSVPSSQPAAEFDHENNKSSGLIPGLKSELIETFLDLEVLDVNLFRSKHLMDEKIPNMSVYGGQVVGQALIAASRTVPVELHPHSLHSYFLKAGDPQKPILYFVDRVREGKNFCTRSVKAVQEGNTICTSELSFHKEEPNSVVYQSRMPEVKMPEQLEDADIVIKNYINSENLSLEQRSFLERKWRGLPTTFKIRLVNSLAYLGLTKSAPHFSIWVKSNGKIGDDVRLHHCVAAYISDCTMAATPVLPHQAVGFRVGLIVSLDHSIWIHRYKFAMDDWMLYETNSTIAAEGRSLIFGRLWSRDGSLVLSASQEVLIRAKVN